MDIITLAVLASQAIATPPIEPVDGPVIASRFVAAPLALPALEGAIASSLPTQPDTVFEYSAAYYKRLTIHRVGSYTLLPLFAFQYLAGSRLYDEGDDAPAWARNGHPVGAAAIGVLFVSNTVTGLMNLYEGRKDPDERGRKFFHATMMLAADVGFTTTAIMGRRAAHSGGDPAVHRTAALASVATATIGYLSMLDIFRKD